MYRLDTSDMQQEDYPRERASNGKENRKDTETRVYRVIQGCYTL